MAVAGYDILINGVPRTFRDVKSVAETAAVYHKRRSPNDTDRS